MKYFIDTEFHEYHKRIKLFGIIPIGKPIPTIDLISIGIKAEDGREYYAICKDFNIKDAWNSWQPRMGQDDRNNIEPKEYWLRDNVLLSIYTDLVHGDMRNHVPFTLNHFKRLIKYNGKSKKQIAEEIIEFCSSIRYYDGDKELPEAAKPYYSGNMSKRNNSNYQVIPPIEGYWKVFRNMISVFYGYYSDYDWVVFAQLFGKMIDLPKGFPMYCIDLKQTYDEKNKNFKLEFKIGGIEETNANNFLSTRKTYVEIHYITELKKHPSYPKQSNEHNALADAKWNFELYKFLQTL